MRKVLLACLVFILILIPTSCAKDPEPTPNPIDNSTTDPNSDTNQNDTDNSNNNTDEDQIDPIWAYISPHYQGDIWLLDADGQTKQVTRSRNVTNIAWSPDGKWLSFIRSSTVSELWLMNADGTNAKKIADRSSMRWSPDSTMIAFYADGGIGVYHVHEEIITYFPLEQWAAIGQWHPEGKYLAMECLDTGVYVLDLSNGELINFPDSQSAQWREDSLVVATLDIESEETEYGDYTETHYFYYVTGAKVYSSEDFSEQQTVLLPERIMIRKHVEVNLSPTGRYLATSNADTLWVIDLQDGTVHQLAQQEEYGTGTDFYIQFEFHWSPVEDILLVLPHTETDVWDGSYDICLYDISTFELITVIKDAYYHSEDTRRPWVRWDLDGSSILELHHKDHPEFDLYQRNLEDGSTELIIENSKFWPQQRPGR